MASLIGGVENKQIIIQIWLSIPVVGSGLNNVWLPSRALIDTGANMSGVSSSATTSLMYSVTSRGLAIPFTRGNVATPNQPEDKPDEVLMYDVDVALGIYAQTTFRRVSRTDTNWIYHTLKVSIIQPRNNFDMLLGMDFLQHCHLSVAQNTFILSN